MLKSSAAVRIPNLKGAASFEDGAIGFVQSFCGPRCWCWGITVGMYEISSLSPSDDCVVVGETTAGNGGDGTGGTDRAIIEEAAFSSGGNGDGLMEPGTSAIWRIRRLQLHRPTMSQLTSGKDGVGMKVVAMEFPSFAEGCCRENQEDQEYQESGRPGG